MKHIHLNIILLAIALLTGAVEGRAQGTAFTYQGRLQSGGNPANALYEMSFGLYDAATNGNLVGTPVTVAPVPVSNGLFTVTLDFGADAFLGSARWLEITVNLFGSDMVPTTLRPRQPLTSVPYAIRALSTELGVGNTIEGMAGTISGGVSNQIQISGVWGTIGGGNLNVVNAIGGTVGGGRENQSVGFLGTISGGWLNSATNYAAVGGGVGNRAYGFYSAIGGGEDNETGNSGSVVAGGSAHSALAVYSSVGGGYHNRISSNSDGATIGGGFYSEVNSKFATIGGGNGNQIQTNSASATLSGGSGSLIAAPHATVGGGEGHRIASGATWATIGGGSGNSVADGAYGASVGGGSSCAIQSNAIFATIPGGAGNVAGGPHSFAAGRAAQAIHSGAFVWADSLSGPLNNGMPFASLATNEFAARSTGGARFVSAVDPTNGSPAAGVSLAPGGGAWSSLSDRNAKEHLTAANGREILEKVVALPLASWNYKSQDDSIRHIGPMAQDFRAAFGLGEDDRHINTVDADGVALAAIQGLNQKLEEREARIKELEQRLESLERLIQQQRGVEK